MNLRDEWRERVAEVVAEHECLYEHRAYPAFECSCGEWNGAQGDDGGDMDGRSDNAYAHARHVADALLAPGGVVAGIVAEALRAAADELPRRTEGADRAGTETWRTHDRDVYSLAIEEAQGALRACADKAAPDDPISTPVRRPEPLSGSGEGAGPSDGAEGVERGEG